jgi:hypothetical protein
MARIEHTSTPATLWLFFQFSRFAASARASRRLLSIVFGLQRTAIKGPDIGGGGLIGMKLCRFWVSQSCLFPLFPRRMSKMRKTIMTLFAVVAFASICFGQVRLQRRPPELLGAKLSGKELVAGGSSSWQDRPTRNGKHLIYDAGPGKDLFYLAYDPEGKSNSLNLSPQAGPGTVWNFVEGDQKRLNEGHRESYAVATPSEGPLAGFQIIVDGNKLIIQKGIIQKGQTGLRFRVYYDNLNDGK